MDGVQAVTGPSGRYCRAMGSGFTEMRVDSLDKCHAESLVM